MNDRITELAKQVGVSIRGHYDETGSTPAELQRFYELVRNEVLEEAIDTIDKLSNAAVLYTQQFALDVASYKVRSMKK